MAPDRTAEESKRQYIEKMGEELGAIFHSLCNEVAWLYYKWDEYVELFGTKPSRIKLLNQAAPRFFWVVEKSLREDTILHIARLTDPPETLGKANLTIKRLSCLVDGRLKQDVSKLVKVAEGNAKFCRDWRHRHIAHTDLKLALRQPTRTLAGASHEKVKAAMQSLSNVLNYISEQYMNATISFKVIKGSGGALELLYVLDDGIRAKNEKQKRIKEGKYSEADLKPRDL